jgi:hypothetical protein
MVLAPDLSAWDDLIQSLSEAIDSFANPTEIAEQLKTFCHLTPLVIAHFLCQLTDGKQQQPVTPTISILSVLPCSMLEQALVEASSSLSHLRGTCIL